MRTDISPRQTRTEAFGVAVVLLGLVLALTLAWSPVEHTIGRFIYDDMFYYLKVAQNIAAGNGSSFDGISATNGYHPLWMVIVTLLAFMFSGDMLVHAALTIAALLHAAQGLLLLRMMSRVAAPGIALALVALYVLNWRTLAINLCGLETALAVTMALAVVDRLMTWPTRPRLSNAVVLGVLAGLAALSRFDLLMLVGLAGLWVVFSPRYEAGFDVARRIKLGLAMGLAAILVVSVWFPFSLHASDTLLPNSREAVKLLTGLHYDYGNLAQMREMFVGQIWSFIWWSTDMANLFGLYPVISPEGRGILAASALVVLLFLGVSVVSLAARDRSKAFMALIPLTYVALHFAYYGLFHRVEIRYVLAAIALFFVPLAFAAEVIRERLAGRAAAAVLPAAFLVAATFSVIAGVSAYSAGHASVRVHKYHYVARDMARWLAETHPGVRTAAWNAGILGYFSNTVLFNLDGVINDDALDAVRTRQIDAYILGSGVEILVDEPSQMAGNLARFAATPDDLRWLGPVIHESRDAEGRVIVARRIVRE
jgi:hypothetical protein